jgi:hypothetical protein
MANPSKASKPDTKRVHHKKRNSDEDMRLAKAN